LIRSLLTGRRLFSYGVTGLLSALTHLGSLILLVEVTGLRPVIASTIGFILSIAVSFTLQHRWVFPNAMRATTTLPRFLVVAAVGLALNTVILTVGTEWFTAYYVVVQMVAFVVIPVSNYLLNGLWTFRGHTS
jgi:putative flippase GtrA